jgi:ferredoxin-nitrite reductase
VAGVYFRLTLGGITGHRDFARDTGIIVRPQECTAVAAAIVRAFSELGDRTDRKKARLKYVLDRMGLDAFIAECERHYGRPFTRFPLEECEDRPAVDKHGHIGVHPQKQVGFYYIGLVLPVGRLTSAQMRGIARIADRYGSGTIRLTVWQNLLISDIAEESLDEVKLEVEALGLDYSATNVRGGLVACTGSAGCKYAAADTKRHAIAIAEHLEERVKLDTPVNIHLTGCHHSCAQHYIGDIGLLACKVQTSEDGDTVEGYHIHVGGGFGADAAIAPEIYHDVKAEDAPKVVERMLKAYLAHRASPRENFLAFTRRHEIDALRSLIDEVVG